MEESTFWIWLVAAVPIGTIALTFLSLGVDRFIHKAKGSFSIAGADVEVFVRENKLPCTSSAIVAPVAPDLKMVAGIAKWIRDSSANTIQTAADGVAPLDPGSAWLGPGGRYRFGRAALAVVMDDKKRATPDQISDAIAHAMRLAAEDGAGSIIIPDPTEDLLQQPNWITSDQRRTTGAPIAKAVAEAIALEGSKFDRIVVWVWRAGNEDLYLEALDALEHRPLQVGGAAVHA